MASHRIGARLAGLSPEQFLAFIEEQAPLWSDAALRVAEEHAARLVEQPEWVLSEVLLSPDLAPHILAQLPTNAHAAKGTCRAWRRGWKETLKKRERARLLVIGGSSGGVRLNSLERYDPSTNEWEEETVAPMPTPRRYVRTAALDGKLYAAGGVSEADNLAAPNLVERYDLATNAWEAVTPMATARASHAMAVLDGRLYAAGGHNDDEDGHTSYLTSVERYDPATNAWEAVAPMATARCNFAMAVVDGKLYAVGGYDSDYFSSVERYDSALDAWEAVAPMTVRRVAFGVAVLDGKLYAVGGSAGNGGHRSSVERYDPALDAWEAVAPMAAARCHLAVAVLDGKLYAVGGQDAGYNTLSSVERYDPDTNAWEAVVPIATARRASIAVLMQWA